VGRVTVALAYVQGVSWPSSMGHGCLLTPKTNNVSSLKIKFPPKYGGGTCDCPIYDRRRHLFQKRVIKKITFFSFENSTPQEIQECGLIMNSLSTLCQCSKQ
jgi:hypothetical protein